jgi:hypothetical protein
VNGKRDQPRFTDGLNTVWVAMLPVALIIAPSWCPSLT